jgi:hypothetical protein
MNKDAAILLDRIYVRANSRELTLEQIGQQAIETVVADYDGNRSKAAEFLQVSRSKVVKVLKRAQVAVLVVLLLTGCAGKRGNIEHPTSNIEHRSEKQSDQMLLPPLPRATRGGAGSETSHAARAVAPPVGPRTLRLEWDKSDPHPETVTQVWQAPEVWSDPPEPMIAAGLGTLVGEFSEPRCEVPATGERMFYIIRNRLGDEFSDWARK